MYRPTPKAIDHPYFDNVRRKYGKSINKTSPYTVELAFEQASLYRLCRCPVATLLLPYPVATLPYPVATLPYPVATLPYPFPSVTTPGHYTCPTLSRGLHYLCHCWLPMNLALTIALIAGRRGWARQDWKNSTPCVHGVPGIQPPQGWVRRPQTRGPTWDCVRDPIPKLTSASVW